MKITSVVAGAHLGHQPKQLNVMLVNTTFERNAKKRRCRVHANCVLLCKNTSFNYGSAFHVLNTQLYQNDDTVTLVECQKDEYITLNLNYRSHFRNFSTHHRRL